eukprot:Hpha_TRINITY_DN16850_c1_g13::TRINITY_DN16850_c1_g13_i1::g.153088::m.153088/K03124/TFIIB, GTF2B, SUA7, tfb; transcription initiation factor TFIIB
MMPSRTFRPPDDPTYAEAHDPLDAPGTYCKNPECRSAEVVNDWECGDLVCSECGWVQQERVVDPGKEWRGDGGDGDGGEASTRMGDTAGDAFGELFDGRGQIKIGFKRGDKMAHLAKVEQKFKESSSARDRKLMDLQGPLKKFAEGMPVRMDTNVVALAAELLVRVKVSRYTPALAHAGLWEAARVVGVPLTRHDFVLSLTPLAMKQLATRGVKAVELPAAGRQMAEKELDTARARVAQLYGDPDGKAFLDRAKKQFQRDEGKVRLGLFQRWGESLAGSEGYKAGEVALEIRKALHNSQHCSGPSPEVIDAVSLYKAMSWILSPPPTASAAAAPPPAKSRRVEAGGESEKVTLGVVADCVGAARDKAEALHAKLEGSDSYATRELAPKAVRRVQQRQQQKRAAAAAQ